MTITQNPQDSWTSLNDAPPTQPPLWRRPVVIGSAAAVLLAAGIGAGVITMGSGTAEPSGPANAPASLPDQVGGLSLARTDTAKGQQKAFEEKASKLGGVTVIGRTYTSKNGRRTIKVVIGRTDLTGKLDLTWPADAGRKVGEARCTSNLKLTKASKPAVRSTMLVCWRTGAHLSAYSVVIDFDHTPKDSDGVAALQEAWHAAS
jgi:hypothetical protein